MNSIACFRSLEPDLSPFSFVRCFRAKSAPELLLEIDHVLDHSVPSPRTSSTRQASRLRATGAVVCLPCPRVVVLLVLVEAEIVGERFDAVALEQ